MIKITLIFVLEDEGKSMRMPQWDADLKMDDRQALHHRTHLGVRVMAFTALIRSLNPLAVPSGYLSEFSLENEVLKPFFPGGMVVIYSTIDARFAPFEFRAHAHEHYDSTA